MTVRERIKAFVREFPGRTQRAIAEGLFGARSGYQQRVNTEIRLLVLAKQIRQVGSGGPSDPYLYFAA